MCGDSTRLNAHLVASFTRRLRKKTTQANKEKQNDWTQLKVYTVGRLGAEKRKKERKTLPKRQGRVFEKLPKIQPSVSALCSGSKRQSFLGGVSKAVSHRHTLFRTMGF